MDREPQFCEKTLLYNNVNALGLNTRIIEIVKMLTTRVYLLIIKKYIREYLSQDKFYGFLCIHLFCLHRGHFIKFVEKKNYVY